MKSKDGSKTLYAARLPENFAVLTVKLERDGKKSTSGLIVRPGAEGEFVEAELVNLTDDGKYAMVWSKEKPANL